MTKIFNLADKRKLEGRADGKGKIRKSLGTRDSEITAGQEMSSR